MNDSALTSNTRPGVAQDMLEQMAAFTLATTIAWQQGWARQPATKLQARQLQKSCRHAYAINVLLNKEQ
jgi:hypothetical protein